MPSTGQGLGEINRLRTGMDSCRQHPTPHKAARKVLLSNIEFRVGLLDAALQDSNPYIWLFIKLGLATGLRPTEILTSRFDGFNAERRRLKALVKGGKWRDQPLTPGITKILEREREMTQDREGWLFPSTTSKKGHILSMSKAFERCVKRAGLDPNVALPHCMRHTAITRLAATGADIKTIQEFSGHESLAMVLRYAHAQDDAVDRALEKMEKGTVAEHPRAKRPKNPDAVTQKLHMQPAKSGNRLHTISPNPL